VTANLGIAIAETGRRVVLVDMDLRRPGLSKFFNLENKLGVGDIILDSERPLNAGSIEEFAQETSVANLFLLSAGTLAGDKLPLMLYNTRLTQLLERLGRDFDFVLVDTAPVGLFADARVLGRLSDGVILVLRADQTTKDSALETRRRMEDDGTPLVGMILNDSRIPEVPSYYLYHTGSEKPRSDYKS
jgi:succinoglycan biosynthesis transport protein ExoP